MARHGSVPGWCLCIATLNRRDALMRTLDFAARQTCPPAQIVVVDVSEDWEESRAEAERVLTSWPGIAFDYVTAPIRSSATQRNAGIALCRHEIVFLLDDDSFLHPDAAEQVLRVYAADPAGDVAAVAMTLVPDVPPQPDSTVERTGLQKLPQRKRSGRNRARRLYEWLLGTRMGRWFNRKVLLQNKEELFIEYDGSRRRDVPTAVAHLDVTSVKFLPGCGMTVRRPVAMAEPFDTALRYYAAFEDLDVAYRYARHGALLKAPGACLHHFEAAGGRLKRRKLVIFQLLNMLVFLKRHAREPDRLLPAYRRLLRRRLLGEALKDLLSGRFGLPQARGVWTVMRTWRTVWAHDAASIDDWYPPIQRSILDGLE